MMEFVEGVKAKETLGIAQILEGSYEGKKIRMNGAVHNVRDMGEVAFVILRKAEDWYSAYTKKASQILISTT